ncbi:MAG: NHL repeat-containing protein, partial [Candidatus Micrarchaeia archaeon]
IFAGLDNQLYIADTGNDRIEVFYSNLTFFQDIGKGRGGVLLNKPQGVFVNEKFVFVADTGNNRVVVFDLEGNPLEIIDPQEENYILDEPKDVFFYNDKIYIVDSGNSRVQIYNFNLELPKNIVYEKLINAEEKLENIEKIINQSELFDIKITSGLEEYYKDANFKYLEKNYTAVEDYLDLFDKYYFEELEEINTVLKKELVSLINETENKIKKYELQLNLSDSLVELTHARESYKEELYIDSLNSLYLANQILLENDIPIKVIIETDDLLKTRIDQAQEDLDNLKQNVEIYKQNIPFNSLDNKLEVAISYFNIGDLDNSNETISSFEVEFNNVETQFNNTKNLIDETLALIKQAEELNNSFFENEINRAKSIVYEDPEEAKQIIEKILEKSSANPIVSLILIIIILGILAVLIKKVVKKTSKKA